jgi:hypothetical protein
MEDNMTAYNVVRFKVKPDQEKAFIEFHKSAPAIAGMRHGDLVKTGDNAYCLVAKWDSFENIAAARPAMIAMLDQVRHMLVDLGGGLGVTDPVSGSVVVELPH